MAVGAFLSLFRRFSARAFGGFICFIFKILSVLFSQTHIPDIHHVFPFHLLPLPLLQYYPSTLRQQQFSDSPLRHFLTTPHSSLPTAPLLDIIRSARLFTPRAKSIRRQTFSHLFAPPDKPLTSPSAPLSHTLASTIFFPHANTKQKKAVSEKSETAFSYLHSADTRKCRQRGNS